MPAGDGLSFKYGDYEFDPRPLFTVNKEIIKTPSNTGLATRYSMTLEGTILPTGIDPISNNKGGLTTVLNDTQTLRNAFAEDFKLLLLQCDSEPALISGYPKVLDVNVNSANDNYIRRADYTISLEMPSLTGTQSESAGAYCDGDVEYDYTAHGLVSLSDELSIEFLDERAGGTDSTFGASVPSVFSVQRVGSAQGDSTTCEGNGGTYKHPWEKAHDYIKNYGVGFPDDYDGVEGLFCLDSDVYLFNNFRNVSINKGEGSVQSTETWVASTLNQAYLEEFEATSERSTDGVFTSVTVNGTIQGLSSTNYDNCPPTSTPKYNNAFIGWTAISSLAYGRAAAVYTSGPGNLAGSLNTATLSQSIGYNPIGGSITYNLTYNDRPVNCVPAALTESITYTYNDPSDLFASHTILGKASGPLFQQLGTKGPTTREINIDAILPLDSSCVAAGFVSPPAAYDAHVAAFELGLNALWDQVFVNSETVSWEPKVGHLTLNKSWTVGSC